MNWDKIALCLWVAVLTNGELLRRFAVNPSLGAWDVAMIAVTILVSGFWILRITKGDI